MAWWSPCCLRAAPVCGVGACPASGLQSGRPTAQGSSRVTIGELGLPADRQMDCAQEVLQDAPSPAPWVPSIASGRGSWGVWKEPEG